MQTYSQHQTEKPLYSHFVLWFDAAGRPYSPQAFDAAPDCPEQAKRVEGGERGKNKNSMKKSFVLSLLFLYIVIHAEPIITTFNYQTDMPQAEALILDASL